MRQTDSEFAEEPFIGFVPPTANWFKMPNEWIDITAHIDNLAELKVVQYVLRHTWGFHEYAGEYKHITIDEFIAGRKRRDGTRMDSGTGLSEQSVRNGLAAALKHGFLEVEVDESDKARIRKYYRLKMFQTGQATRSPGSMNDELEVQTLDLQTLDLQTLEVQSLGPDPQSLEGRGLKFRPRTSKDTSKRHSRERQRDSNGTRRVSLSKEAGEDTPLPAHRGHWKEAPLFIQRFVQDFSAELGDAEHVSANITHAHRLFLESKLESEEAFEDLLYAARERTKRAYVKKRDKNGRVNRMPYFFSCLEELAGLLEKEREESG